MIFENIISLMDRGFPVGVKFNNKATSISNNKLYCELVQYARGGKPVSFSEQGCPIGAYVLGQDIAGPDNYYFRSGRYKTESAADLAAASLPQLEEQYSSIELFPVIVSPDDFDVLLLFLKPAQAMRISQALSYFNGLPLKFESSGTASICGECTVKPSNTQKLCISLGCKGSRKHSRYGDDEVIVGIPANIMTDIEEGLASIPGISD